MVFFMCILMHHYVLAMICNFMCMHYYDMILIKCSCRILRICVTYAIKMMFCVKFEVCEVYVFAFASEM